MVPSLTDIERKILDYMVHYLRTNTYQPSIREIGERFGIKSTKTVSEHLQALADKGFLERDPSRSRGVKILGVDLSADTVSIPCYRDLPAEKAGPRSERPEMHLSLDRRLGGSKGGFFLRARGEELAGLGVQEGDFVLIEPAQREELVEGDVVVSRQAGLPEFHRVAKNGRGISLRPLRSGLEGTAAEESPGLLMVGKVTALFRRLDGQVAQVSLTAH